MTPKFFPISILTSRARGELHESSGQRRVIATAPIPTGALVAVFGGVVLDARGLFSMDAEAPGRVALQVDEDAYLYSTHESAADWINHSCGPNTGLVGEVSLIALRRIELGEEITFDYATADGSAYDEFDCGCGSPLCRGRVLGSDWKRPELWSRYGERFSPYLRRRIEAMKRSMGHSVAPTHHGQHSLVQFRSASR